MKFQLHLLQLMLPFHADMHLVLWFAQSLSSPLSLCWWELHLAWLDSEGVFTHRKEPNCLTVVESYWSCMFQGLIHIIISLTMFDDQAYICFCRGVSLTFVLGFLLMILTSLMFFFGASAQKVCNAVEAPQYPLFAEVSNDSTVGLPTYCLYYNIFHFYYYDDIVMFNLPFS